MDTLEAILTRRSIREFTSESIPEETVTELLRAAMQAPSAHNCQPWQFIVVTEKGLLEKWAKTNRWAKMAAQAPLGILVCADLDLVYKEYWPQECAAATQNILLAAHAKGLGAVWTGAYPVQERIDDLREIFGLPERIIPFAFVVIGHSDEEATPTNHFRPDRIRRNKW